MSFALCSPYVSKSESYIIKSSFELRALLACYDLEKKINRKKYKIKAKSIYDDLMGGDDFTYKKYVN